MVRYQNEVSSVKKMMGLCKCKYSRKSLLFYLTLVSLSLSKCFRCISFWVLSSIFIIVKKYCSNANFSTSHAIPMGNKGSKSASTVSSHNFSLTVSKARCSSFPHDHEIPFFVSLYNGLSTIDKFSKNLL